MSHLSWERNAHVISEGRVALPLRTLNRGRLSFDITLCFEAGKRTFVVGIDKWGADAMALVDFPHCERFTRKIVQQHVLKLIQWPRKTEKDRVFFRSGRVLKRGHALVLF